MLYMLIIVRVVQNSSTGPHSCLFHVSSSHIGDYCIKSGEIEPSNANCNFTVASSLTTTTEGFPTILISFLRLSCANFPILVVFPTNISGSATAFFQCRSLVQNTGCTQYLLSVFCICSCTASCYALYHHVCQYCLMLTCYSCAVHVTYKLFYNQIWRPVQ